MIVMSPGPVFLPLTTRVHHLPSSWTNFPKLHTPDTHPTPSCSPSSWTIYTPHSATLPVGIVHLCVLSRCVSHAGDTCTVCRFLCPNRLPALFLLPCWPFCCLLKYFLAFGPRPCSSSVPSLTVPWQRWIRVLSSETIGHVKKTCICIISAYDRLAL